MNAGTARKGLARAGLALLAGAALSACRAPAPGPTLQRYELERPAMGTLFRVALWAGDSERALEAAEAALARVAELDATLSDYDEASELSRLSRSPAGLPVPVSEALFEVLAHAQRLARESGGAFDVTVGPYVRLWRRARRQGELPSEQRLAEARAAVGYQRLVLDAEARTATLLAGGMRLDLGGIAKGYALDQALEALARHGVERALVDGGGDVAASGPPPGRAGWRVALALGGEPGPEGRGEWIELAHGALATSGDAFQSVTIAGVTYSHLVDPRTGLGLTGGAAAAVLAPSGMRADALASAACVLSPEAALGLVASIPGCEARVARGRKVRETPGFEVRVNARPGLGPP